MCRLMFFLKNVYSSKQIRPKSTFSCWDLLGIMVDFLVEFAFHQGISAVSSTPPKMTPRNDLSGDPRLLWDGYLVVTVFVFFTSFFLT